MLKCRDIVDKGLPSRSYGFSRSHVWMRELDYKESWAQRNWCFWTAVLEKPLKSPLDCKKIQPVHPKGNQSLVYIGKTDAEAETPILWSPDEKNWFIRKDPDAGQDWRQEEKGMTEDEMAGWHHWLNGRESEWTPGVGDGQGGLACCDHGVTESRTRLSDWTELKFLMYFSPPPPWSAMPLYNVNEQKTQLSGVGRPEGGALMPYKDSRDQQEQRLLFWKWLSQWKQSMLTHICGI